MPQWCVAVGGGKGKGVKEEEGKDTPQARVEEGKVEEGKQSYREGEMRGGL